MTEYTKMAASMSMVPAIKPESRIVFAAEADVRGIGETAVDIVLFMTMNRALVLHALRYLENVKDVRK